MKAAIHNPYWDTLGGGERYTASFIKLLLEKGYKVDIEWQNKDIIKKISDRFAIDISESRIVDDIKRGDNYDVCFWMSDGSIPTLKSRNNILHFQFPFQNTDTNKLLNRMKLFRIKNVVCNSQFTKSFIDKEYGINSFVIYPPIDVESFKPAKKENKILYVGRFSQLTQSKNQHILVEEFKKLYDMGEKSWKLVLAGGAEIGSEKYIVELRNKSKGYPISIKTSLTFKEIKNLYAISKIFWSAAGVGVDESKDPLKVEHFGMSVVEAMSSGCVPIIPMIGGFKEIIKHDQNGLFWKSKPELIRNTLDLIKNKNKLQMLSDQAREDSHAFSIKTFNQKFSNLL